MQCEFRSTPIPGCYEVQPDIWKDSRGRFVKVFQRETFARQDLEVDVAEQYYSRSTKGVVRGLHFQTPPHDHAKIVYCVSGEIFDVVVDLRLGSPSYGQAVRFVLSAEKANCLYIPRGLAHGFCVTSDAAIVAYSVGSAYISAHDSGILWSSVDVDWPVSNAIVSSRDAAFLPLGNFISPFSFEGPLKGSNDAT